MGAVPALAGRIHPLLAALPEPERARFLALAHRRRFGRGDTVFHAGDRSDGLHLVLSGRFAVRAGTLDGDTATLSLLGPGTFFGELSLLEGDLGRRSATVSALEPAETLEITAGEFSRLRHEHRSLEEVLLAALGQRVRELSELLVEALFTPVETRVLTRVLDAAEEWGGQAIPLTQQDVAELAGTTRPTANRVLRQAEAEGLVRIGRGQLRVPDRVALGRRVGRT